MRNKGYFFFITFFNIDVIKYYNNIKLREYLYFIKVSKYLTNLRKSIIVFNYNSVKLLIVNIDLETTT